MKTILYSPTSEAKDNDTFFESMEVAIELGGDILVFPENAYTPYNSLLESIDILNGEEYDTVLECLYDFCAELGHAAVFNATDDFGFNYSIFANPMAHKGETFNKLYIKHTNARLTCFDLEDYDKCIAELFEPIIYRGRKIALCIGEDIFLPNLLKCYGSNKADFVINSFSNDIDLHSISIASQKIAPWQNQVITSCGFGGNCFGISPSKGEIKIEDAGYDLYTINTDNCDYLTQKSSAEVFFDSTEKYLGKNADKYKLLK